MTLPRRLGAPLALALAAAAGCGTTGLSARARGIVRVDMAPAGCAELGRVQGFADPFFGALQKDERLIESARKDALDHAARAGATHVRFLGTPERQPSGTFGGGDEFAVTAIAYRCGPGEAPPSRSAGGCTKDTDCKGDRICEAGSCVNPAPLPGRPSIDE